MTILFRQKNDKINTKFDSWETMGFDLICENNWHNFAGKLSHVIFKKVTVMQTNKYGE